MSEINVVSLFSGGGGLDLGFLNAGFNIIWANDNDKNAVSTYKKNIGHHIIQEDVNRINIKKIPSAEVIIGGPPCQSFSLSGKRNANDDRGMLVWKYIEIVKHSNPKAFVFENVQGLLSAKDKEGNKVFDMLMTAFDRIGYSLSAELINAADYGVPQLRKRVIIVGLKGKEKFKFPAPTINNNYVSVSEALSDLPKANSKGEVCLKYASKAKNNFQERIRNDSNCVNEHAIPTMSELDKYIISHVKPGGNYMDIPEDVESKRIRRLQKEGGRTTFYGRMDPQKPSYTINTYFNRPNGGCFIHYSSNRLITIREALRLQSFPDSYQLVSTSEQGKRNIVGNAVPPFLSEEIAKQLKKYLR